MCALPFSDSLPDPQTILNLTIYILRQIKVAVENS